MPKSTIRLVYNNFPAIVSKMAPAAIEIIAETLVEIDATVQTGMAASGSSSAPGEMPGIDTGALRASLQHELDRGKYRGTYFTGQEYAQFLEYGTSRGLAPRPFMTPAAEQARPGFMKKMKSLEDRLK